MPRPGSKILTREELLAVRAAARSQKRAVVQCHGCFDIVHPGHVRHLRQAKGLGDLLLVTITGDGGISKGVGRPLIPEELRAENLAALDFVDWVYIEPRPTAAELLDEVRPDVYVKGREYEFNDDPRFKAERAAVERHGGRVVFSSGDVVFSSTALISALEHSVDPFQARLGRLLADERLQGPALSSLISSFRGRRVVVVGETILDTYVLCDRPEVAGESPIMTLRPVERRRYDGGAAVIARHLAAMGARPVLVTALPAAGGGEEGEAVRRRLAAEGIEVRAFPIDRPLPEKQRFLVGAQKVMKVDLVEPLVLDATRQETFIRMAADAAGSAGVCDGAIVADFGQGLFTPHMMGGLCRALRPRVGVLAGDVSGRRSHLTAMTGMDLLCPSESELRLACGAHDEALPTAAWRVLEMTGSKAAAVTMGPEGLVAFERLAPGEVERRGPEARGEGGDGFASRVRGEHIPAMSPFAIDALGCGDALLAAATLALASGGSLLAAAFLGSLGAAVQAQRIGNLPVSATDLRHALARVHTAHLAFAPQEVVSARSQAVRAAPVPA